MYLRKERRLQCPPLPRDFVFLRVRADGTVPRKDAKRIDASLRKRVDGAPTVAVPDVPFADDDPVPGAFPDRPPCGGPLGTAGAARRRLVLFGKAYSSDVTGDGPRAAPRTFAAFSPSRLSPRALTLAFWGFLLVVAAVAHTKLYYGTQLATWLEMYPPQPRVCDAHAAREPSLPPLAAPLRAAVLVLYDDAATESRLSGFGALAERSIANKRAYCEAHGYVTTSCFSCCSCSGRRPLLLLLLLLLRLRPDHCHCHHCFYCSTPTNATHPPRLSQVHAHRGRR